MRYAGVPHPRLTLATLALALLGVGLLAGCGKKGPPEPVGPPSEIIYPKTYPTR